MSSGGFWREIGLANMKPTNEKVPASSMLGLNREGNEEAMYLFRDERRGLHGPMPAIGLVIGAFLFCFWLALQAGANLGVVVVNFFTALPIVLLGIGAIVFYWDAIPRMAALVGLADLIWLLVHPVRHSAAERARELSEFGGLAWQGYLDAQAVDWGVFVTLAVMAVLLFRRQR